MSAQDIIVQLNYYSAGKPSWPKQAPQVKSRALSISGWRGYNWDGKQLRGLAGNAWHKVSLEATCLWGRGGPGDLGTDRKLCIAHLRGAVSCSCGIYGQSKLPVPFRSAVIARCSAWGIVQVDKRGNWKASDCTIEELFVQDRIVEIRDRFDQIWGDIWPDRKWHRSKATFMPARVLATKLSRKYNVPVTIYQDEEKLLGTLV